MRKVSKEDIEDDAGKLILIFLYLESIKEIMRLFVWNRLATYFLTFN